MHSYELIVCCKYYFYCVKKFYNRIPAFLKNKYSIALIAFILWLSFFDKNDFITQYQYRQQLKDLQTEKQYFTESITKAKKDLDELMSSPESREKFAREKYLMKKDNEDLFVFVKEPAAEKKD